MTTIPVRVEAEANETPSSGMFMIATRIDRPTWSAMQAAGAWYFDADELEDMDRFGVQPGWRYSRAAMEVLLLAGHTLVVRGQEITTVEAWNALWTDDAKASYAAKIAQERADADAAQHAKEAAEQAAREAAGAAYDAWKVAHLTGLAYTTVAPPVAGDWRPAYRAEKGTPGAWYDTGDTWSMAQVDGQSVYRCYYGNAVKYYAPDALVNAWTRAKDTGTVGWARWVLEYYQYAVYGSDVADRLVALHGLQHYIDRAGSEPWYIKADDVHTRERDIAARYGIEQTPVQIQPYDYAFTKQLKNALGTMDGGRMYGGVGQTADGTWLATASAFNGGGWRVLTGDECQALGLDTTPPASPPQLPAARSLETHEENQARSNQFSAMFRG